ncbi:MAG: hypothetical protein AB1942_19880 [Pseudomonadota bacterium]
MQKLLLAGLAGMVLAAGPAAAQSLQVSYPGDASMDCAAISAEVARMDQFVLAANAQASKAEGQAQGANLGATVAVQGMLRTGLLGRVPGAGQLANQAANAARQRAEQVKAQAAADIQTAGTRKALLSGLYSGKACDAPPAEPTVAAPAAPLG